MTIFNENLVATGPAPAPDSALRIQQRTPRLGIALIALAAFGLELAVSGRYGYVRDELYFLAAGQHLAFGYVDQPALTPLLARLAADLTGNSLVGLRLLPALALAGVVIMTAAMSRLAGAGRSGQLLAALAAATCGEYIAAMHELTTTTPDFFFWALTLLLFMRLLTSRDPRWWLAIGGCTGLAASAKWNIGFLVAAVLAGLAVTDARPLLRSRYLLIGGLLAAVLAAPDVIWQATHGWPNLDVFAVLQQQAAHNRAVYWPAQVLFTGLALTPIWIAGLVWSVRGRSGGGAFRGLGIGCALVIAVQFALGGKAYYSGGAYAFLLATGCVPLERWLAERSPLKMMNAFTAMAAAMLTSAAVVLPIAIPVLPAQMLHSVPLQKINYDLAESIAWPKQVALIGREYHALPAALRRRATILAGNYGEAGALDRYGSQFGLPQAYSGANNFWLWGPPPAGDVNAIAINVDPSLLRREFRHVKRVATFWNGLGVSDDEQGAEVFVATGLKTPWTHAWLAFRNFG